MKEGIVKFNFSHKQKESITKKEIEPLNNIRKQLREWSLLGVYPADHPKNPKTGYGNISKRVSNNKRRFIITGTQTSDKKKLTVEDYCRIISYSIKKGTVDSEGLSMPSSETLTHAAVYDAQSDINFVCHVHNKIIWKNYKELELKTIPKEATFGSLKLAKEIRKFYQEHDGTEVVIMLGHEEGILLGSKKKEDILDELQVLLMKTDQL
jgi:hypothetical protein